MDKNEISKMIDHTLLVPFAKEFEIRKLCSEAKNNNFASVCVNPSFVSVARDVLKNSDVKVCTVIGFPLGAETSSVKAFATKDAIQNGADEIDMVINIGAIKDGDFKLVESDIKAVVESAKITGNEFGKEIIVKVILETCYLDDNEIVKACIAAKNANADFVKTSTGFGTPKSLDGTSLPNGASVHHVELMKKTVGQALKVKAAGGIRSAKYAQELIEAGADRLGTSAGILIVNSWNE